MQTLDNDDEVEEEFGINRDEDDEEDDEEDMDDDDDDEDESLDDLNIDKGKLS